MGINIKSFQDNCVNLIKLSDHLETRNLEIDLKGRSTNGKWKMNGKMVDAEAILQCCTEV